jgi:hypothetical protein
MHVRETLIAYRDAARHLAERRQRLPSVACDRCEVVHRRTTVAYPAESDYLTSGCTCDGCEVELATYEFVRNPKIALERVGLGTRAA